MATNSIDKVGLYTVTLIVIHDNETTAHLTFTVRVLGCTSVDEEMEKEVNVSYILGSGPSNFTVPSHNIECFSSEFRVSGSSIEP